MEKWAGAFHLGHGQPLLGAIRERAVAILDFTRMATSTLPVKVVEDRSAASALDLFDQYFSRLTSGLPARWNLTTAGGLLTLVFIWAASLYATWATWGSLQWTPAAKCTLPPSSPKERCSIGMSGF